MIFSTILAVSLITLLIWFSLFIQITTPKVECCLMNIKAFKISNKEETKNVEQPESENSKYCNFDYYQIKKVNPSFKLPYRYFL